MKKASVPRILFTLLIGLSVRAARSNTDRDFLNSPENADQPRVQMAPVRNQVISRIHFRHTVRAAAPTVILASSQMQLALGPWECSTSADSALQFSCSLYDTQFTAGISDVASQKNAF